MVKFKKTVFLAALLLIGVVSSVHAKDWRGSSEDGDSSKRQERREMMEKQFQGVMDQLKLTDDQKQQLKDNKQKHREKMGDGWEQKKAYRDELNQELMKPELDMNKINAIHAKFKADQTQMSDERLNAMLEVRKILTAEQYGKFVSLMEEHKAKWKDGKKDKKTKKEKRQK